MADRPPKQVISLSQDGCVHDVEGDASGTRLATCGSNGWVSIWALKGDRSEEEASFAAHDGGVWRVSWAHPRATGNAVLLATCGEDGYVHIWRDAGGGKWAKVHTSPHCHTGGTVALSWAPFEHGCHLAAGGADGMVSVLSRHPTSGEWILRTFNAHCGGVTGVSWAPYLTSGALIQPANAQQALSQTRRFVTGGCDGQLRVWSLNAQTGVWDMAHTLAEHCRSGVVAIRDVQWAKNCGLPFDYIASCADDKLVLAWRQEMPGKEWKHRLVVQTDMTPCRLSWSQNGTLLAISFEDHSVSVWKEEPTADWRMVSRVRQ